MVDAVVVGAGPAGAIAALRLARAGARVRLLDRATFPRDKLCGDTLNPGALAILDRLDRTVGARVRERALRISGMTVTGPGGASASADYPHRLHGIALARRDLDQLLVEAAIAAGAQFEPGVVVRGAAVSARETRVTGIRVACGGRDHVLDARIVIAADGRSSRLASGLGLARFAPAPRRWAYGAYFAGVRGLTTRGEMHVRADGYVGIAPLPDGLANVCTVRTAAAGAADRGRNHRSPAQIITDALAADPLLRDRVRSASRVSDVAVLGPLAVDASAAGCPGLLLAGDAAGFIDPMTGDGMRFALRGAELAADAAIRELETAVPSHVWLADARSRAFSAKWRINRALRALVASPRALDLAAIVTRHWAAPMRYVIGVAGDVAVAHDRAGAPARETA